MKLYRYDYEQTCLLSRLNLKDIEQKLEANTKFGNPKIKGTPFAGWVNKSENDKIFFGDYMDSKFRLTRNSSLFPIPYIFQGDFKSVTNSETEISLKVMPIWFGFIWIRIPFFLLILFNLGFLIYRQNFDLNLFIFFNIFFLILLSPLIIINYLKTKMFKQFVEIFEVYQKH